MQFIKVDRNRLTGASVTWTEYVETYHTMMQHQLVMVMKCQRYGSDSTAQYNGTTHMFRQKQFKMKLLYITKHLHGLVI